MYKGTQLFKTIGIIILVAILSNIASNFILGFLLVNGGNLQIVGTRVAFDPLITIAYILVYHFLNQFFQPTSKAQFYLFLVALYFSFTVGFIQGSISLVCMYILLRKFRII